LVRLSTQLGRERSYKRSLFKNNLRLLSHTLALNMPTYDRREDDVASTLSAWPQRVASARVSQCWLSSRGSHDDGTATMMKTNDDDDDNNKDNKDDNANKDYEDDNDDEVDKDDDDDNDDHDDNNNKDNNGAAGGGAAARQTVLTTRQNLQ
jgi:hypothetical protein